MACAAAGCDPVLCQGAGIPSNAELFERSAGDPRRRQLLDPGLQGGRRHALPRRARRRAVRVGRRGPPVHRPRAELRRDDPRSCPPGDHCRRAQAAAQRHVVRRADAARDAARRGDRGARAELRAGAADELRYRGDEHRGPAGPRLHRSRPRRDLPWQLPRRHRRAAGGRRQRCRHAWASRERPACRPAPWPTRWSCRTTRCRSSTNGSPRVIVEPVAANMGVVAPAARIPRRAARRVRPGRRVARLRRGDHRLPPRARRRPGQVRRVTRPHHVRQGHRRWSADRRRRRARARSWRRCRRSAPCSTPAPWRATRWPLRPAWPRSTN